MYTKLLQTIAIAAIFQAGVSAGNAEYLPQVKQGIKDVTSKASGQSTLDQCNAACGGGKEKLTNLSKGTQSNMKKTLSDLCADNDFCNKFPGQDNGVSCQTNCSNTLDAIIVEDFVALLANVDTAYKSCTKYCKDAYGIPTNAKKGRK